MIPQRSKKTNPECGTFTGQMISSLEVSFQLVTLWAVGLNLTGAPLRNSRKEPQDYSISSQKLKCFSKTVRGFPKGPHCRGFPQGYQLPAFPNWSWRAEWPSPAKEKALRQKNRGRPQGHI